MPHGPVEGGHLCGVVKAFEQLIERGVVRRWGLSIVDKSMVEKARACAKRYDIAAVENIYNVVNRADEHGLLPYARREGLLYIAASPLARGVALESKRLRDAAMRLGKTPAQIALRWLMEKDNVVPIPKTTRPERVAEFAGAYGWRLPEDAARALEA